MIPGGTSFKKQLVKDIVLWAEAVQAPAFVIGTEWTCRVLGAIHLSMVLQHGGDRWCVSSIPTRSRRLPGVAEGMRRHKQINMRDPRKCTFYLSSDAEMLDLLEAMFDMELWSSGGEAPGDMEAYPRLFRIDHHGFMQRIFCNSSHSIATSLYEWRGMVKNHLTIIRLLTPGASNKRPRDDTE